MFSIHIFMRARNDAPTVPVTPVRIAGGVLGDAWNIVSGNVSLVRIAGGVLGSYRDLCASNLPENEQKVKYPVDFRKYTKSDYSFFNVFNHFIVGL